MNNQNMNISFMINRFFNENFKTMTPKQIANDYPKIQKSIFKFINTIADNQTLDNMEKEVFIDELINKIKIKGLPLRIYKEYWEKENKELKGYEELYNITNELNIFPKKNIEIPIDNEQLNIEVLDTGKKYIPTSDFVVTQEIIDTLDDLKEKEKINKLANILEEGFDSIPLTLEERKKVDEEISRRIKEKLFITKNELDNLTSYNNNKSNKIENLEESRENLFNSIEKLDNLNYKIL